MQQPPNMQQLLALAQSDAGRQLMAALQGGGEDVKNAASLAASGNVEQAKQALGGLLKDPQIQRLLRQLEEQL